MKIPPKKQIFFSTAVIFSIALISFLVIYFSNGSGPSLESELTKYGISGKQVLDDLEKIPQITPVKAQGGYEITDNNKDGLDIHYAGQAEQEVKPEDQTKLTFPESLDKPLVINLPGGKSISITDKNGNGNSNLLSKSPAIAETQIDQTTLLPQKDNIPVAELKNFIKYQTEDQRKSSYYAYQKDQASGEKKLKNWTIYEKGSGKEQEAYLIENANISIDESGNAKVFFDDGKAAKNQEAIAQVDQSLVERAQKAVMKDAGTDILSNDQNQTPDFTIPRPYYIDSKGQLVELKWNWDQKEKTLSTEFEVTNDQYPIALDPTLAFTAPGQSNTVSVITGEASFASLGWYNSLVATDFNVDGKMDLVVGTTGGTGRIYVFYADSLKQYSKNASAADAMITGTGGGFGISIAVADFNNDGKPDIAAGAYTIGAGSGNVWLFYNDATWPSTTAAADVSFGNGYLMDYAGQTLAAGDFNGDGKADLAIGIPNHINTTNAGRVSIFYNGNFITGTVSYANVIIEGEAGSRFGSSLSVGDFNGDGITDLAVGAPTYDPGAAATTGRVYVFNGGSMASGNAATTANAFITGQAAGSNFGNKLTSGDLNADGKNDLIAVGLASYNKAYIFYNGSITTKLASAANVIITGEGTLGDTLATGDFNNDGRIDLIVGSTAYASNFGRAYIFYNDGSIPTTAATADIIITGEATGYFGSGLAAADINDDGKVDIIAGANGLNNGRIYIFYSQNGQVNTNKNITGDTTSNSSFGGGLATGDFNADGKMDLVVGAYSYNPGAAVNTGRVYIFMNKGLYASDPTDADVIITGEATGNFLGRQFAAGDFNTDGKTDLAVGAHGYNTLNGRAYIFNSARLTSGSQILLPLATLTNADVIITGEVGGCALSRSLAAGDFNADGKTDLAVGANNFNTNTGRAYIFNSARLTSGSQILLPMTTLTNADVIITGESNNGTFGFSLIAGDFNADGKMDLAVGGQNAVNGRVYIFKSARLTSGSQILLPLTTLTNADVVITGEAATNLFGMSMIAGDFNADGKTDLAVGANGWNTQTGRVYIFNSARLTSGSQILLPLTTLTNADVVITGEATTNYFSYNLSAGDFNADGKTDLVVGAYGYNPGAAPNTGRAYIFNSARLTSGSQILLPMTTITNADIVISSEQSGSYFSWGLLAIDFNTDGKTDLVVGAYSFVSGANNGRVYFYETRDSYAWILQKNSSSPRILGNVGQEVSITGAVNSTFGTSMAAGDFNADGKMDLAVGAPYGTSSRSGIVYIFYNDGNISTSSTSADVTLIGETGSYFGSSLVVGDFNADGKTDLAVASVWATSYLGRVYVFNGGSMASSILATSANVIITGESINSSGNLGTSIIAGDFNADGKTDLAAGEYSYNPGSSAATGRAYIFYSARLTSGSQILLPLNISLANADVVITGEAANGYFGGSMTAGDFNADGKTDLGIAAYGYSANAGRAYIFNGGSMAAAIAATSANVIITGEASSNFGYSMTAADFNADGKNDLAVGAINYSSSGGRVYIFNGGSMAAAIAATSANVVITGEASSNFGYSMTAGDFNADGKNDLAVGAYSYNSYTGRSYIFNGGSLAAAIAATSANVIITGEAANSYFGTSMTAGDFNADGKNDLAVGAFAYANYTGKVYIYTNNETGIIGEASSNFGFVMTTGDFNADGKMDLAVGAYTYNSSQGRAYVFYGGTFKSSASATIADVIISGQSLNDQFGAALGAGDFNADGKTDLVVGANNYSSSTGRAYIFNGGSLAATIAAASANVIITGGAGSDYFGNSFTAGDFDADGKTDLVVGAFGYNSFVGRVYIFNGGSMAALIAVVSADYIFTGEAGLPLFGTTLAAGDFNADGKTDLVVGAQNYSAATGRAYIFNGGSIASAMDASSANVIITGETTSSYFSDAMVVGDFNNDGKTDLAISAAYNNSNKGRVFIFNGGSMSATIQAASTNVIIDGENTGDYFGFPLAAGDLNTDGKTDLIVGAKGYSTNAGRVYIYYNNNGFNSNTEKATIDSPYASAQFGYSLAVGEFSNDGNLDLVVGAPVYSSSAGTFLIYPFEAGPSYKSDVSGRGSFKFRGSVKFK